jgi:multidrug resistance protein MdtO
MPEKIAKYSWGAESQGISFLAALRDCIKPFPGRGRMTLRLAVACTFIVLIAYTFRMPFQDLMPFFVLFVTKEEKVTTTVTVLLVLFAITIAIVAAILLYKCTGDRAEFRIPGIALEIFVGMYLFRVLSIGPVGWIVGFICAAAQSLVYLVPSPEETVHQFLWLWVAVALSTGVAWLANLLLFPVSPVPLLQREFVDGWHAVSGAAEQLANVPTSASAGLLRPLVKRGPNHLLKLLKLSLIESPDLREEQVQLKRMIATLDKIMRLIFSFARAWTEPSVTVSISSNERAILGGLEEEARHFHRDFEAGFLPSGSPAQPGIRTADDIAPQLLEAKNTIEDLASADTEPENRAQKAADRKKPSLFVADAFSNPRHAQFAIKVTLAGMLGYLFYTASDYYGIHTVFYTPLIIALTSTGATIHKGFLRIVGCIIGGALGLICTIWVLPRFEALGTFLLIVFCVHGLAAWISAGSERISYIGLQIAMAFDLGFLQGYGPPTSIDPLRDRFIGIVLGICIITIVFSLVWPESAESSARERLGACLRAIARLLHMGSTTDGSPSISQREQLELEIASHLTEANLYVEQAAFEALLYGSEVTLVSRLEEVSAGVEEIYVACLPWLREQAAMLHTSEGTETAKNNSEVSRYLVTTMQNSASAMDGMSDSEQLTTTDNRLLSENEFAAQGNKLSKNLEWLIRSMREFQDQFERKAEFRTH